MIESYSQTDCATSPSPRVRTRMEIFYSKAGTYLFMYHYFSVFPPTQLPIFAIPARLLNALIMPVVRCQKETFRMACAAGLRSRVPLAIAEIPLSKPTTMVNYGNTWIMTGAPPARCNPDKGTSISYGKLTLILASSRPISIHPRPPSPTVIHVPR